MTIKQVVSYLESIAPLSLQEEYDNSGLLVGNEEDKISGVLITLDCTEAVLDEAISKNCNLVIAHHPVIFKGLKKIARKNYVERTVEKAIRNNISVYAIHTNLDKVLNGVNKKICEKLGLKHCKILLPSIATGEMPVAGSGMFGFLPVASTEISFLRKIKRVMKAKSLRHTQLLGKKSVKWQCAVEQEVFFYRKLFARKPMCW